MNAALIGTRIKAVAARGVVAGVIGIGALGLGAGLAHADDTTPWPPTHSSDQLVPATTDSAPSSSDSIPLQSDSASPGTEAAQDTTQPAHDPHSAPIERTSQAPVIPIESAPNGPGAPQAPGSPILDIPNVLPAGPPIQERQLANGETVDVPTVTAPTASVMDVAEPWTKVGYSDKTQFYPFPVPPTAGPVIP